MNRIEAGGIHFYYGRHCVLENISLTAGKGEVLGILGANGAGKSTLLKILAGILKPAGGLLRYPDAPGGALRPQWLGYLAQDREVHWPLEAETVVSLGLFPHLQPWQSLSEAGQERIRSAMERTETWGLRHRTVSSLAGGEKTLVLLARVLAGEPGLLLADEPVAGLDLYHQLQVMELLRSWAGEGRTVVAVLHQLDLAVRFCDRLLLVHGRHILAEGKPSRVLSPENLREAYRIEARYDERGILQGLPQRRLT